MVSRNGQAIIGYFAQHHTDVLDAAKTPMVCQLVRASVYVILSAVLQTMLRDTFPKAEVEQIYSQLSQFGIKGKVVHQTIKDLSGGQKSRLSFALLTFRQPHLIVMDEPTNHCGTWHVGCAFAPGSDRRSADLDTIDGLIEAIHGYKGAIVVVSHDRFFLEKVCKEFWSVGKQRIRSFYEFDEASAYSYQIGNITLGGNKN